MATKWISPTWRMPTDTQSPAGSGNNQSKFDNYSLKWEGTSGRVECGDGVGDAIGDNYQGGMAISTWFKCDNTSVSSGVGLMYFKNGGGSGYGEINIYVASNTLYLYIHGSLKTLGSFTDTTSWHHLLINITGSTTSTNQAYLDGSVFGSAFSFTSSGLDLAGEDLYIGTYDGTDYWQGDINNVSIFDYALSETQVKYLYNNNDTVNPTVANPQNPMAIPGNSPIAYYDLGGSSTGDAASSSPNTLTVPNSSVPSATVFNFGDRTQSEYIGLSRLPLYNAITVSTWIKTQKNNAVRQTIISNDQPNSTPLNEKGWQLAIDQAWDGSGYTKAGFFFHDSTGATKIQIVQTSSQILTDNQWHHVVALWDGTTNTNGAKIFVDGLLAGQGTSSFAGPINKPVAALEPRIGTRAFSTSGGGNNFGGNSGEDGFISNLQTWDSSLTFGSASTVGDTAGGQIAELYNNGKPYLGTQPQADNLKGWWRMNIDTSNWNGSDWIVSDISVDYKNSLGFSTGAKVHITSPTYPTIPHFGKEKDVSFSVWIRTTNPGQVYNNRYPFSFYGPYGNDDMFKFKNGYPSNATLMSLNSLNNKYSQLKVNDGNWHHYAMTYNYSSGDVKYYIDGSIAIDNTGAEMITNLAPNPGRYFKATLSRLGKWVGQLSNLVMFDGKELTSTEVNTLYNNGVPEVTPSFSPTSWWKLDNTTTGIQDSIGSNDGTNDGAVASGIAVSKVNGTSSGMTTANLVNSDLERSIPYSSYSMYFDGTDYIDTNSTFNTLTSFSISAWFKAYDTAGVVRSIVSTRANGLSTSKGLDIFINGNVLAGRVYDNGETEVTQSFTDTTSWHNVVMTYDGTTLELFLDNSSIGTATGSYDNTSGNNLLIGKWAMTSYYFDGQLSNISIFNKVLSENEISTIYNGGIPNNISSLSPVSWWSLAGDSYYNGTDWICPDLVGSNNGDSDGTMGGDELVGDGPGGEANGEATGMNIPENLKGNAPNSTANAFSVNMNFGDKTSDVPVVP